MVTGQSVSIYPKVWIGIIGIRTAMAPACINGMMQEKSFVQ